MCLRTIRIGARAVNVGAWPIRVAALAALAVGAAGLMARPAAPTLTAVFPADNAILARAPDHVSLIFDGEVQPAQVHITVARADGRAAATGNAKVDGDVLSAPVSITGDGTYLLGYHVVLADGQAFSGVARFGVSASAAAAAAPQLPGANAASGHVHGRDPLTLALTLIAVVSVIFLLVMIIFRPRPRPWQPRRSNVNADSATL